MGIFQGNNNEHSVDYLELLERNVVTKPDRDGLSELPASSERPTSAQHACFSVRCLQASSNKKRGVSAMRCHKGIPAARCCFCVHQTWGSTTASATDCLVLFE